MVVNSSLNGAFSFYLRGHLPFFGLHSSLLRKLCKPQHRKRQSLLVRKIPNAFSLLAEVTTWTQWWKAWRKPVQKLETLLFFLREAFVAHLSHIAFSIRWKYSVGFWLWDTELNPVSKDRNWAAFAADRILVSLQGCVQWEANSGLRFSFILWAQESQEPEISR